MQFLYLILLTTATFCYDPEVLNYPEIFKAKYKILEKIKNKAYLNPVPDNYNDYLQILDFSGNFIFDIVPIDKWEQEAKKILLFSGSKNGRKELSQALEEAFFSDSSNMNYENENFKAGLYYINKPIYFHSETITTSKGEFIMFYLIIGNTYAVNKKTSGKVKVCTNTKTIFKKCAEYDLNEAVKITSLAYTNFKIKEIADTYN